MSYRQRCVKHKMENILAQIPKDKHKEVQPKLNRIFYGATSLEQTKQALKDFKREYSKIYPFVIGRLEDGLDQSLAFYLFPSNHWKRIRTSNRLERMNKEIRRRLRVIGRHPSESGCLSLVFQVCKRNQENKNAFIANDLVLALWKRLKNEKIEMITQLELDCGVIVIKRHSSWILSGEFPPISRRCLSILGQKELRSATCFEGATRPIGHQRNFKVRLWFSSPR